MFKLIKETGESANFSIILPGGCNANCDFCFWGRCETESPMFSQQLRWWLSFLGDKVTQISITGGEPTMSPVFDEVMDVIRNVGGIKVVLTTNGKNLIEKMPVIDGVVHHLNISRHAVDDVNNRQIFKTTDVPSTSELEDICEQANSRHIDVTLNKVVDTEYNNKIELDDYVNLAKSIGASAIALRKDYSSNTLESIPLEKSLGGASIKRTCPVCVTNSYLYKGMPIHFKMSLEEPSDLLPYIYEFIYHPNGILSEDWNCEKPIDVSILTKKVKVEKPTAARQIYGGCGQTSNTGRC